MTCCWLKLFKMFFVVVVGGGRFQVWGLASKSTMRKVDSPNIPLTPLQLLGITEKRTSGAGQESRDREMTKQWRPKRQVSGGRRLEGACPRQHLGLNIVLCLIWQG